MSSVGKGTRKKKLKSQAYTKKSVEKKNSIILYPPNKNIKPGNNFYMFINGNWIKNTKIPSNYSSYGVSEEVNEHVKNQLKDIMYSCIKYSKTKPSNNESYLQQCERSLGNLAQSVLKNSPENVTLLKAMLIKIQSIQTKDEVARMMGEFARYTIPGFINIFGSYMSQRNLQYCLAINGVAIVGLPKSFYLQKSMGRANIFKDFLDFINKIASLLDCQGLHEAVYIEKEIAKKFDSTENDEVIEKKGSQLEKEFKDIPWEEIFKTYGFAPWNKESFFVKSVGMLHYINNCFRTWSIGKWRKILSFQYILFCLSFLPDPFDTLYFDFYKKKLDGILKKSTLEEKALLFLRHDGSMFLSRLYVEKYLTMSIKKNVERILSELRDTAKERLDKLDWLEKTTRAKAVQKVEKMRAYIGFPDAFYQGPIPLLNKDYIYLNVLQLNEWYTIYGLQRLGQSIDDRKDWPEGIYNVNAYYRGDYNGIVVPSGMINFPFYLDKPSSFGFNFGGLGCVIAHEITHAFDEDGKDINPEGFVKKWWTSNDLRHYTEKTKDIIELYNKEKIDNHHISGSETLSENIADIGGMAIALATLKKRMEKECLTEEARKQTYRDFFTAYAISWRQMDRKKKILFSLLEDVHSPSSIRVNLVVNQFQEWYDTFNVDTSDKYYIPPEKRISIF